jgi:hypothetical protein
MVTNTAKLTYSSSLASSSVYISEVVKGTKENDECSNRGICDKSTGLCACVADFETSNGYNNAGTRGDCGFASSDKIEVCPGVIACSGHGICFGSPTYACQCANEWTGADCSLRVCPLGLTWFDRPQNADNIAHDNFVECSNAGDCDRETGSCLCREGFTGASCDRLDCPGSVDETKCNGHGKCLDMSSLARLSDVNGESTNFTYGAIPNNPYTWDYDRISGCFCDEGYEGFDCSLKTCPYGPDPLVSGDDAQQLISCTDADQAGTIILSFRQQSTTTLSPTISTSEMRDALMKLSSVGRVKVSIYGDGNDTLCTSQGNTFIITFQTIHGSLPNIQFTTLNIDTFSITTYQVGTKKDIVCSGRGLCDHSTGLCECFAGFGSSNGDGSIGDLRDCGYRMPIISKNLLPNVNEI